MHTDTPDKSKHSPMQQVQAAAAASNVTAGPESAEKQNTCLFLFITIRTVLVLAQ